MVSEAVERTAERIATMEVRGAATIARAAAEALATAAEESDADTPEALRADLREAARVLHDTRPTAVSLPNALRVVLTDVQGETASELRASVVETVDAFVAGLDAARDDLGRVGANRLRDGDTVMTHCHSTDALACVEHAVEDGKSISAYVKETRPRQQGHVTAHQLAELGVDVTLIVDSAAHRYLDDVDHVLVGADAVTADGSVINKVGTAGLAVSARERGVPVLCAAQTLKLHPDTLAGHSVEIEMRGESEVIEAGERERVGDIEVANPAFDVTPARFVDAVVTERGQFPPQAVVTLMRERYGDATTDPWAEPE
ncbi:ribose 1,5-bisphosphate isomerase [Halocalculus aciditolerans]|uniref:Ribose 1,5-bisphosphate isomerase n=1 Tax=Halocalculus aciditolerans TaxID=1383812 RepID=A0A830F8N2_9EURY|nr:ribose 1,5-bisphosphate isomerase [Halocalculus aciditolerans]GGL50344.1 ribose 1,5-bisphosphate isomerase [Halocalculus aciditolerans]